jgi:hypothetical protein
MAADGVDFDKRRMVRSIYMAASSSSLEKNPSKLT